MASKKKVPVGKKIKRNPWILSTLILGILAIVLIVSSFGGITGQAAGEKFVEYVNSRGGTQIEFVSASDFSGSLYEVVILANGNEVPVHITKDGGHFVQVVYELEGEEGAPASGGEPAPADVPKSDKPEVELFVMSHCPYGTQAEKGIIPAVEALGDSIDFKLRFVYYAMHPTAGEVEEQLNQYCIQKEEEEKLIPYLKCFLDSGEGDSCLVSAGINMAKLNACTAATDAEFDVMANLEDESSWMNGRFPKFDIDKALNDEYGIKGSPSLVVNGKMVNSGRDPQSYLNTICAGFNEAPSACDTELSSTSYGPGFGYDTTGSGSSAQCG